MMTLTACQATNAEKSLPTLARFPTLSPSPIATDISSFPSNNPTTTINPIPSATITNTPIMLIATSTLKSLASAPSATNTLIPLVPVLTATALPEVFVFGQSADSKELKAFRYGTGSKIIMLVGGIHAGFEANTVELMGEIQQYLENNPTRINEQISFLIIPSINPDGLTKGRTLDGRFNGNGVDLNRNWACGWSEEAVFQDRTVDAGDHPFSESETIALGGLIQRISPAVVLFYHAAADGVFAGSCENHEDVATELASIYGENSGYSYGKSFSAYEVTGTAPSWVTSLGIPSLDVELATSRSTDFDRNLRALMHVQEWLATP